MLIDDSGAIYGMPRMSGRMSLKNVSKVGQKYKAGMNSMNRSRTTLQRDQKHYLSLRSINFS